MTNTVDKTIIEILIRQQGINLPGIGSLSVKFIPAAFINSTTIRPPHRELMFSEYPDPKYPSAETVEGYAEWAAQTERDDEMLKLNGIGVVRGTTFYPSVELYDRLNPQGIEPLTVSKHRNNKLLWGIVCGIVLILAGAYIIYRFSAAEKPKPRPLTIQNIRTEEADVSEKNVEAEAEVPVPTTETAPESLQTAAPTIVEKTIYHVVVGVFSSEENADKMIANDPLKIGKDFYQKIPFSGGKTLVSAFASEDRQRATVRMRELRNLNGELWLHAQKISQQQ